jgi:hypothetical protein
MRTPSAVSIAYAVNAANAATGVHNSAGSTAAPSVALSRTAHPITASPAAVARIGSALSSSEDSP